MMGEGRGHDKLSCWFELSYAAWLTIPRVLMEAMPDDWQGQMAELLMEYSEAFPNQPDLGTRVQCTTLAGTLTKTPDWVTNYRYPDHSAISKLRPHEAF